MAMTQFEKQLLKELQGIRKELHEMNKKRPEPGQVDGRSVARSIDIDMGAVLNNRLRGDG
ncbi:hypothetical protein [Bacillus licheniformis]|uniref:hypothetical protein n=1 Tax=Bacillus licheniformis TaxID=1402 RepID=UPI000B8A9019|nr:hypothetical protein [Bacillus licheniformis]MED0689950.1 hypothetical protein [Bacillus licheniformis]MED0713592.1 hypothetical protein [Bacillus licheniformis]MED0789291.1 hypothetical protein [Bacillus licheniformis]TWM10460.1 hypothetical protein CHCC15091_0957 [Bacillus licheniformis]WIW99373.1 hypothetical protein QQ984_03575 [Bacillus licheniformis]